MKIKKYKRGGDPRHVIEYEDAPGRIDAGKIGTNMDAPTELEQAWRELRSQCTSVYGQSGLRISEVRWSYPKDDNKEDALVIGTVPHWSGDMKAELPKFSIRVVNAYDDVQEKLFTERRHPKGLETVGDAADRVRDALERFVREGTQQMELGFSSEGVDEVSQQIQSIMERENAAHGEDT